MSSNRKIYRLRAQSGSFVVKGFMHGLSQMASLGGSGALIEYPKPSKDSMRGDWKHVGDDMKRGLDKVRSSEKSKAK